VQGSSTRLELAAALGVRLVARCAGEAFSSPGAPSSSHERAKPQSLNEDSPRDERFSQFSLLAHVVAFPA
jgi:hypothetical protein